MMGNARMSIRSHVTAAGALAGAGILTLALVVAPPHSDGARTEVRAVQLTALAASPAQFWGALEKFIGNRIPAVAPVAPVVEGGGTAPVIVKSTAGPATNTQKVEAAALAAPNPLAISGGIFAPVVAVVGILLLFGPLILLVILACPICAIVNELSYFLPLPTLPLAAAVPTAMAEAEAASSPELTNEPVMKKFSDPLAATEEPAEGPPVTKTKKVDVESPTEPATQYETQPTAVNESKQAGSESPAATKPTKDPETRRPVVRDSLDASEQLPGRPQRDKGDRPTSKTVAGVDEAAASESSSAAAPSPKDGDSPKGDADSSE